LLPEIATVQCNPSARPILPLFGLCSVGGAAKKSSPYMQSLFCSFSFTHLITGAVRIAARGREKVKRKKYLDHFHIRSCTVTPLSLPRESQCRTQAAGRFSSLWHLVEMAFAMAITMAAKYLWLLAVISPAIAGATCYVPPAGDAINGVAEAPQYNSCNPDQAESMCCRNETTTGEPYDTCAPNGLCRQSGDSSSSFWRESCTDSTWKSPACLKLPCDQVRSSPESFITRLITAVMLPF
jgi:hypothetical protein